MMRDISQVETKENTLCPIDTYFTMRRVKEFKFKPTKNAENEAKGRILHFMQPEVLAETLAKPEETMEEARQHNPNIKGRIAYSYPVYEQNTRAKIEHLQARMDVIDNRSDRQWQRLRKQLLALKDRLQKRTKDETFQETISRRQQYLLDTLTAVQQHTTDTVFADIMAEVNESLPILTPLLDANFSSKATQNSSEASV